MQNLTRATLGERALGPTGGLKAAMEAIHDSWILNIRWNTERSM
jgi:hypothetical protein